jgi:hypothetical protein
VWCNPCARSSASPLLGMCVRWHCIGFRLRSHGTGACSQGMKMDFCDWHFNLVSGPRCRCRHALCVGERLMCSWLTAVVWRRRTMLARTSTAWSRHVRVCAPLCVRVRVCARADGDHALGRRQGHVHRHQRHRARPVAAVRVCALPHRHGAAALPGPLLVAGVFFFGARYCFACRSARVFTAFHPRMYPTSSVHLRPAPTSPSPLCACTCGRPGSGFRSPWLVVWPRALRVCA